MATASISSQSKSTSFLSRWLKNSWISRLGLFWRQELTESSKKKTSPQLQVEALEQKAVCMDMMGAVKAGAMGLGLAALAGPLATPVEVTMKGWGAGQSTPAPKDQQSSKGKQLTPDDSDEFFTRHSLTDPGAITIVPLTKPEQEGGGSSDETTSQQEPPQPARDLEDLQMVSVLEPDAEEDQWLTEVDQALQGEARKAPGPIVGPNDVGAGGGGSAGGGGGTESSPPQFNTNSGATTTSRAGGGSTGGAADPLRRGDLGGNQGGGQAGGFHDNQNDAGNGGSTLPGGVGDRAVLNSFSSEEKVNRVNRANKRLFLRPWLRDMPVCPWRLK